EHPADRKEDLQRRIKCRDLEDDCEESQTIPYRSNMALAYALLRTYRHEADRIAGAEKGHRYRGRIGKPVGEEVKESFEQMPSNDAESGGQVEDRSPADQRRKTVIESIGEVPTDARVGSRVAGPYGHVVALLQFSEEAIDV